MLRDFPRPGCPVLFPLELAIVFGLFWTGKYVTVPLVFGRGRLSSVVVWSWSMGLARLGAQGAVGVLSGLVARLLGDSWLWWFSLCVGVYSACVCLSGDTRVGGGGQGFSFSTCAVFLWFVR